jgi:hypothetical protein
MPAALRRYRNGQISIDYIAGALVFFGSIIVLISSVLNVIPQFQNTHAVNELELAGWGLSETMMNDPGYWSNTSGNGTDWHTASPANVTVIGVQAANRTGISAAKIRALRDMNYRRVQRILGTTRQFTVSFTKILHIDTYRRFNRSGSSPGFITEPSYPGGTAETVHYGSKKIDGTPYRFLLADSAGWYNNLWVSEDWDFTDADTTKYNLTTDQVITLDADAYRINIGDVQIGQGNTVILKRRIGRIGTPPTANTGNIIEMKRYGTTKQTDTIIAAVFQVWA